MDSVSQAEYRMFMKVSVNRLTGHPVVLARCHASELMFSMLCMQSVSVTPWLIDIFGSANDCVPANYLICWAYSTRQKPTPMSARVDVLKGHSQAVLCCEILSAQSLLATGGEVRRSC